MIVTIDVDDAGWNDVPGLEELATRAVNAAVAAARIEHDTLETTILFTGDEAMMALNAQWRGKAYDTNVLSFAAKEFPAPAGEVRPLGDIVLASGVVKREAAEQGKILPDHTTHLIIHGLLHLLGYDHETDAEAAVMEGLEIEILKGLGISNPYDR